MTSKFALRLKTAGLQGSGNGLGVGLGGGGGKKITLQAFGMHIGNLPPTTVWGEISASANTAYNQVPMPNIGMGSIRLWDSDGCSWRNIEKTQGVYSWGRLDNAINLSLAAGLDIIFTLGCGPDWATVQRGQTWFKNGVADLWVGYNPHKPSSDAIWISWCSAIATRYAGLGIKYEIWNEVNDQSFGAVEVGSGFVGTAADLVHLTQLAQQTIMPIDPTAKILSANFVGQDGIQNAATGAVTLDSYLAAGGASYCDIISVHAYNTLPIWTRPEGVIEFGKRVRDTLSKYGVTKPVWNTEWGYGTWRDELDGFHAYPGNQMPDSLAQMYITRMLILSWCAGFDRFYFYALDGVKSYSSIVMVDPATALGASTLQAAAIAYKYFSDLMTGGYLSDLQALTTAGGKLYYSANFTLANRRRGVVYWCDNYDTAAITITGAKSGTDNIGNLIDVSAGSLTVNGTPKFIYYT